MNNKVRDHNCYIFAGGKTAEIALFKSKAIAQYGIEQLQPVVSKAENVFEEAGHKKSGSEVIADLIKGIGSAVGVYTALNYADTGLNFIVSLDTPFIARDAIEYISKSKNHAQICLTVLKKNREPLSDIYSKECFFKCFADGRRYHRTAGDGSLFRVKKGSG